MKRQLVRALLAVPVMAAVGALAPAAGAASTGPGLAAHGAGLRGPAHCQATPAATLGPRQPTVHGLRRPEGCHGDSSRAVMSVLFKTAGGRITVSSGYE